jgi:hypothetical protein
VARPSKIDRLPDDVKELIGALRRAGRTIDEILAKLKELEVDVGRSGLGEHIKKWDMMAERLHRSKAAAEAIMQKLEDTGSDDRVARMNVAALHASIMELLAGEEGEPVTLAPKEAMLVSTALKNLASAGKSDLDRFVVLNKFKAEQTRKIVVAAADEAASTGKPVDLEAVLKRIREEVYGIFDA